MEDSQEKDYSFLGNDTFPNLYNALVYERKFKSEYLERQIYQRLLKRDPSVVKLMHLSMLSRWVRGVGGCTMPWGGGGMHNALGWGI